ncbi:hypothetical protein PS410_09150 [Pediococcus acidilactici]
MIKWQGFYLSDHTSALNAEHETKNKILQREVLPQMTVNEITDVVNKAIVKNKTVKIQTNTCDNNGVFETPVVGKVSGYMGDSLYVNKDNFFKISSIRNVIIMNGKFINY